MAHLSLLGTILLTVYGQLVFKWQVDLAGPFPPGWGDRFSFILRLMLNPWVISTYVAVALAGFLWMAAIMKLDLSYAYPFVSLTFAFVLFFSGVLFNEPITWPKIAGVALIILGVAVGSKG